MELTTHNITTHKEISNGEKFKFEISILILGAFLCVVSCDVVSFGSGPTTKPDPISTWFSDLANRDASVREQARINLMGISRTDLERLRKLVETSRPLAPSSLGPCISA